MPCCLLGSELSLPKAPESFEMVDSARPIFDRSRHQTHHCKCFARQGMTHWTERFLAAPELVPVFAQCSLPLSDNVPFEMLNKLVERMQPPGAGTSRPSLLAFNLPSNYSVEDLEKMLRISKNSISDLSISAHEKPLSFGYLPRFRQFIQLHNSALRKLALTVDLPTSVEVQSFYLLKASSPTYGDLDSVHIHIPSVDIHAIPCLVKF